MKKLIKKTLIFFLPFIFFLPLLEILLQQIPNDYSYKKGYLDNHSNEIETLILGSSHSFYGLNSIYFSSNTFNAAHVSQSLDFDFQIYKKYSDSFESLKTIILPISYFTMWGKLENGSESWRVKNYSIYYDIHNSKSFSNNFEVLSNKIGPNLKRLISYYVMNKTNITCTNWGWGTSYDSSKNQDLLETGKTASLRHTRDDISSERNIIVFNENISILNKIIESKENLEVILFTPPAYKTYREHLNQEQLNQTIKISTEIAEKHDNCVYYNFLENSDFIAEDFFDADHLNEKGAKKLSILLNEKCLGNK